MRRIALVDYGAGNLRSVESALRVAAAHAPVQISITDQPDVIAAADAIVLPGQGAFADCMAGLGGRAGMREALEDAVKRRSTPFLGICVGMQLLAAVGLEHGPAPGLGWLGGECRPLRAGPNRLPHMGWNQVALAAKHPVLEPLRATTHVYFCHSFVLDPPLETVLATAEHGEYFCAAAGADNIIGVQFHPEKSQAAGLALLAAFINWKP